MGIMVQEKLRAAIQNSRKPELSGVLVIDKPAGMTSHDVVNRVRRTLGQRSVGHLGTLDPLATGVLPLVVGHCTRLAQFYTKSEKSYEGEPLWGCESDICYGRREDQRGLSGERVTCRAVTLCENSRRSESA